MPPCISTNTAQLCLILNRFDDEKTIGILSQYASSSSSSPTSSMACMILRFNFLREEQMPTELQGVACFKITTQNDQKDLWYTLHLIYCLLSIVPVVNLLLKYNLYL
uniref:Uncharacterized protein n=1 Tax=Glossina palpalis gambiensis TaxID=67801 RepID=A0A1B0AMB3_9MUSC